MPAVRRANVRRPSGVECMIVILRAEMNPEGDPDGSIQTRQSVNSINYVSREVGEFRIADFGLRIYRGDFGFSDLGIDGESADP